MDIYLSDTDGNTILSITKEARMSVMDYYTTDNNGGVITIFSLKLFFCSAFGTTSPIKEAFFSVKLTFATICMVVTSI